MQFDEFLEIVKTRRCVHKFKPDPIPDGCVEKIIETARWAMSGGNAQPWEFIVVKEAATKQRIADLYGEVKKGRFPIERTRVPDVRHHMADRDPSKPPPFRDAPVLIIVCGDRRTLQASILATHFLTEEGAPGAVYLKNMANATQHLHLAARALGLGSQWVSVSHVLEQSLKPLLDIPPELSIHTMVPVGYPAYEPPAPARRELRELIHAEKYDRSRYRSGDDIVEFVRTLRGQVKSPSGGLQ